MSRSDTFFRLRIPPEILEWVRQRAADNRRSMTGEINFILMTEWKKEKGEAPA